jgi:hypothetical protein
MAERFHNRGFSPMSPEQQFILEIGKLAAVFFAIACATIAIVAGIAFWRTERGAAASFSRIVQRAGLLDIITVILIAAGAMNLLILGKIGPEAAIGLLSGIVGYVLGGVAAVRARTDQHSE